MPFLLERGIKVRSLWLAAVLALLVPAAWTQRNDDRRDSWQRPQEVMDALALREGSAVADVGAGDGYFTRHLSKRVGESGAVFAVDVDSGALRRLQRLAENEKLVNVRVVEGQTGNPQLPENSLDGVLVVNAYHEFREFDAMMRHFFAALKPGGRLAIIDAVGNEDQARDRLMDGHRIAEKMVRDDAERAGFRFREKLSDIQRGGRRSTWFFLLFEKPADPAQN